MLQSKINRLIQKNLGIIQKIEIFIECFQTIFFENRGCIG